ncbi:MAG: Shedu anti-phage system protein SduA domain-containing protein [Cyanobacteria bacterium P01_G01_bin.54]
METPSEILAQIFNPSLGWTESDQEVLRICPSYKDIEQLACLLAEKPLEPKLQEFLKAHPQFLTGLCGKGYDSPLAFLNQPFIGKKRADFAVLTYGQGGCVIYSIEIKRSDAKLYNQSGEQAEKLREAVRQIEDRNIWLKTDSNLQTFTRDTVDYAKSLPQYPERSATQSFRLRSSEGIEEAWRSFKGYSMPTVNHIIIIGRWASLPEHERKRLIHHNQENSQLYQIFTYDQVARRGFDRPYYLPP